MANIALIIAGGRGERMKNDVPKQFMTVNEKPVIAYTMEAFENHPMIDIIAVVCLGGWEERLRTCADSYGIKKLRYIVRGGATGQQSIRNGITELKKHLEPCDVVLIHDAIRPMVSQRIISDCLETTYKYGSAVAVIPCYEPILKTEDGNTSGETCDRELFRRTQTPQGFSLKTLCELHKEADEKKIFGSVTTSALMTELGRTIHFSEGSPKNIKLTTQEDIDVFKALLYVGETADNRKRAKYEF